MSRLSFTCLLPLAIALVPMAYATTAAADDVVCDSCESCTEKLAAPGARVVLGKDLTHPGGSACIAIRGAGAQLDGLERTVKPGAGGTGVRVEAADVLVKNLHVVGGVTGVELASAPRTTVFHVWIGGSVVGVRVSAADEARITRSVINAMGVGISFGASDDGACVPGASVKSPGAVVTNTRVQGSKVGIAACEAYPVLARNEVLDNGVGILLGAPGPGAGSEPKYRGPFEPCVCAPSLNGVKAGTSLLFSSGCGGCQVHEAWMPELRKRKHDILVRESEAGKSESMAKFDAFMGRCAPEVTDALGIPGCVPNYTCLANGVTTKVRRGDQDLSIEAQLDSAESVAAFATSCRDAAARQFRAGKDCVAHALMANVVCQNKEMDIRAIAGGTRSAGMDDACERVEGFGDTGAKACAKPCGAAMPVRLEPAARAERAAGGEAEPVAPGAAPAVPSAAPDSSASEPRKEGQATARSDGWKGWAVGLAGVALAAATLGMLLRSGKKS